MRIIVMLIGALLLISGAAVAQTDADSSPLHDLLAYVPLATLDDDSGYWITYADLPVVVLPGTNLRAYPRSSAEYEIASDLFGFNFPTQSIRLVDSRSLLLESFFFYDELPAIVGFEFFAVERIISFGTSPDTGSVVAGEFDHDAITAAFRARGFVEAEIGGLPALCAEAGCDTGMNTNVEGRDLRNPFGGNLGRMEPIALGEGVLLSSPNDSLIAAMATDDSVLNDAALAALADAITLGEGDLGQAILLAPAILGQAMLLAPDVVSPGSSNDNTDVLPSYQAVALAERYEGAIIVNIIALVYDNADDAAQAAETLTARLLAFNPPEDYTITARPSTIIEADDGIFVALVAIETPVTNPREARTYFSSWVNATYRLSFTPLFSE